jgi:endonuclease/exonuclease/phosphatase family metal-dependent hydrolase
MKFFKRIFIVFSVIILLITILLAIVYFIDFKSPKEQIMDKNDCETSTRDTFSILTWNIGYAGLDASMDFFYEGGKQSRQSKEQTIKNLQKICQFIKSNDTVDFILLQEVDIDSKRTYNINEFDGIKTYIPAFDSYYSINYNSLYIPLPIANPTGKVLSSLVFCTKSKVCELTHYAYPNTMKFPRRTFLYDRCFIAARYNLKNGKQLLIINTHNSAFDNGSQRIEEMNLLKQFAISEYSKGNYVIVGGDWNQIPPSCSDNETKTNENFRVIKISNNLFPSNWQWFASDNPTNRYLDKPYKKNNSSTAILDFFLASPNVECLDIKVVDLEFAHSDHNPVIARFGIILQ